MNFVPHEWQQLELSEVATVQTGIAKGAKTVNDPVELPYLRVANVQDGFLDLSEIKTILIDRHQINRYLLRIGDVLLTEGGDFDKLGRGAVWNGQIENCVHQNHVFVVRTNSVVLLPHFFSALTSSPYGKQYFLSCAKQTTNLASINSTQLKAFPVLIPPLTEQYKIIDILSTCDEAIDLTEQLIAANQRRKQALMQRLLTGKVRFDGFEENWCTFTIADLADKKVVNSFKDGDWIESPYITTEGCRLIQTGNIGIGYFKNTGQKYISHQSFSELSCKDVFPGDILICRLADPIGRSCIVPNLGEERYLTSVDVIIFRVNSKLVDKNFLIYVLNTPEVMRSAQNLSGGSTRQRVSRTSYGTIEVNLPALGEQKRIAEVLHSCDDEIDLLQQKLTALRQQKQGLVQQLLTGKIRIKV